MNYLVLLKNKYEKYEYSSNKYADSWKVENETGMSIPLGAEGFQHIDIME